MLSTRVGEYVVFDCPLDFPHDYVIPYILRWNKEVSPCDFCGWLADSLEHSGNYMYHLFQQSVTLLYAHTLYLCVSFDSQN
jgi:hypothetical protein